MAKIDPDLSRKILFTLEAEPASMAMGWHCLSVEGYDEDETFYHIARLYEEGLIDAQNYPSPGDFWMVKSLTAEGHNFLKKIENEGIWAQTKETIKDQGIPMTLTAIKAVAAHLIKEKFGFEI